MIIQSRTSNYKVIHTTPGEWGAFELGLLDDVEMLSYEVCFDAALKSTPLMPYEELIWSLYHSSMRGQ